MVFFFGSENVHPPLIDLSTSSDDARDPPFLQGKRPFPLTPPSVPRQVALEVPPSLFFAAKERVPFFDSAETSPNTFLLLPIKWKKEKKPSFFPPSYSPP